MNGALRTLPLLAVLAGCASQAPPPVVLDVPTAWSGAPATPPAEAAGPWWAGFGSPELERLVARAAAGNADVAASRQRIAQAAARSRAAGAALYPVLDASGGGSRDWRGERRASNGFRAGLDASYELDVWGLGRAGVAESGALLEASEFDRQALELSLAAEVATTYFQVLSLVDRRARAVRVLDIAERVLDLVETKERFGAASGLELAQQRGAVAALRASLPSLAQDEAESRLALAALLGLPPGGLSLEARSLEGVRLPAVAPGIPAEILLRRPDLRRAEAGLAAARADLAAARAAMLPSIRLTGGAGYASDALAALFTPAGFLANLAAGVAAPVFDAGRLAAQRDASAARVAELGETYRGAVLDAFRDVEAALAATRFLAEAEDAQRVAAEQARLASELAEIRYRAGAVEFLTVLETQRNLFQREESLGQTRLARLAATVGLYRALGGGW